MGKTGVLGSFEELVLLTVVRLGERAYSVPIRRELAERTASEVSMGAVYATLERLEAKGLIEEHDGPSLGTRPGRPRRYYRASTDGVGALDETRRIRERVWRGVELPESGEPA